MGQKEIEKAFEILNVKSASQNMESRLTSGIFFKPKADNEGENDQ